VAFVEAEAPRVTCRRHGVVVCALPWARHGSRFTRTFEDQVAWLAVNTSKSAVAALMRIAWRTVGGIIERVVTEAQGGSICSTGCGGSGSTRSAIAEGSAI
jgi:transposase